MRSRETVLGHRDDLTFTVFKDDKFTVDPFASVHTDNISWINRVHLHSSFFEEGTSKDDIEMRLLRKVDCMRGPGTAYGNGPSSDAV